MYIKRNYGFWMTFRWSSKPFILGLAYASLIFTVEYLLHIYANISMALPWQPISVIGIAVAFYLGFKNNASYDRTWEARKIWGGIVNNSRSFGAAIVSFIQGDNADAEKQTILYRHIAWLTALRFQLRQRRDWEHMNERTKGPYYPLVEEATFANLNNHLQRLLPAEEVLQLNGRANVAVQILKHQSQHLQQLRNSEYINDFRHVELHKLICTFYDDQGRSERIKNFPFPRQYASTAFWQTIIFAALIPFGLLDIFIDANANIAWAAIPFSALIIWVFFLMEKIGDYSENPFEGSYNDIPITSIARTIEIDLLEMINDKNIPPALKSDNGFLM